MIYAPLQPLAKLAKSMARIARKSTLPIIEHVALHCEGNTLTLTANDMERCAAESINVEGGTGLQACCVNGAALALALGNLRGETVQLEQPDQDTLGGKIILRAGRNRITLETLPYDQFPQPELGDKKPLGITPAQLASAVTTVAYAMATKDVRYYLNGIHLDGENAVATDGHRQAWHPLSCDTTGLILPAGVIADIKDRANGTGVSTTENQLIITTQDGWYSTQLVDGKYPDYKRVIPRHAQPCTVTANAEELITALRTAATVAQVSDIKFPCCKISQKDGALHIEGYNTEGTVDAEISGTPQEIGISPTYLIDAITADTATTGSETVTLEWEQSNRPMLVGNNIIMPVRI